jgi:hypothetical protein
VFGFIIAACSIEIEESKPAEVMLHYDSGPLTAEKFKACVPPSTRNIANFQDLHYRYPADQRTFKFSADGDAESPPITVKDKSGAEITFPGIATFTLNFGTYDSDGVLDCSALRTFHERIGYKYRDNYDDWWLQAIRDYMGTPLSEAFDQATKKYEWRDLLFNEESRGEWQREVGRLARLYVQEQAGADFFCSPSYDGRGDCGDFVLTIEEPVLDPRVTDALNETQAEKEKENQATAAQARVETEAETLQSLIDTLQDPYAAVLFWAIKENGATAVPVPFGSDLVFNSPNSQVDQGE